MKKLYYIVFIYLGNCINTFALAPISPQQEFKVIQKWQQYHRSNQVLTQEISSCDGIVKKNSFRDTSRMNYLTTPNDINFKKYSINKIQDSEWQKMNGPFGGSVRQFYQFNDKIYATTDREVFVYENPVWKALKFEDKLCNTITSMYRFITGRIIVTTDFGLYYSDDDGESWMSILVNDWNTAIIDIYVVSNGDILLSTSKGIYISRNNELNFSFLTLKDVSVYTINIDNLGYIWAGTDSGVYKAKYTELIWEKIGLDETYYIKIIFDSSNVVYTYTSDKVLMSLDQGESWFSIEGYYFLDISLGKDENLIITTRAKILYANHEGIQFASQKSNKFLLTAYNSEDKELLVGTLGSGVQKYDRQFNEFIYFSDGMAVSTIRGLVPMANGEILASTDAISFYISKDNGQTWESIYISWSLNFKTDSEGSIYSAANSGLIKSTDFGRTWISLNLDVAPYFINAFDISSDNRVICAGSSTGEVYVSLDAGENFKLMKEADYIFVDAIKIINNNSFLIKNGPLYYTKDGGKTLITINDSRIKGVNEFVGDHLSNIYLASYSGIFKTVDGIKWQSIFDKVGIAYLRTDQFDNLYAAAGDGAIYFSNDQGKNWDKIAGSIPNTSFWSFAITPDGYLLNGSQDKGLYRKKIEIKKNEITQISSNQNFPNPFNNSTRIEYDVPKDSFVKLKIYDLLGREVESLISEFKDKGKYYIDWIPQGVASGIYLYKLQVGSDNEINKMVFLK